MNLEKHKISIGDKHRDPKEPLYVSGNYRIVFSNNFPTIEQFSLYEDVQIVATNNSGYEKY